MKDIDINTIKADIESCQHRVRALQNETIHTITVKPTGKIEVVDKERLESLNSEIARLEELAGHNREVAGRLQAVLGKVNLSTVAALMNAKSQSENQIVDSKTAISRVCGVWLKVNPVYTLENIRDHPRVKPEVESREKWILQEEAKLKLFIPALEEAQNIVKDFQPSGLPPIKQERAVGLVRFEQPAPAPVF
jgi:hypothetical protein